MPRVMNRAVTNSNQVGTVILFCSMAWTNDISVDYSNLPMSDVNIESNPIHIAGEENLPGVYAALLNPSTVSDNEVITSFAKKLYSNSNDIDPEIGRVAKKIMWDLI